MKKILLIALFAVVVASCSKKSDPSPTVTSITGKWFTIIDTTKDYVNGILQATMPSVYNHTDYVQFNADKTGLSILSDTLTKFTYAMAGNALTLNFGADTVGGVIFLPHTEQATIRKLTPNVLVIYSDQTDINYGETDRTTEVQYFTK